MLKKIWSVNEWGQLHEVILGDPAGAFIPSMDDISQRSFDRLTEDETNRVVSSKFPAQVIEETREDLIGFKQALRDANVRVHHADELDLSTPAQSPHWKADQETALNIRDLTLIHGDLTIDSPSPTRGRYYESLSVRHLFQDYYHSKDYMGYLSPPRPRLFDNTYDLTIECGINNTEPLFDAANCMRFGNHILIDINNTANQAGATWLQSTLNTYYGENVVTVHPCNFSPDHIDIVIIPLCEGTAIINTEYVDKHTLPDFLKNWTLIDAPEMIEQSYCTGTPKASNWIGLNLLVLNGDEKTVFVEERQIPLIHCLTQHGFRPIPLGWRHGRSWGGAFHCVTLDVHRSGEL